MDEPNGTDSTADACRDGNAAIALFNLGQRTLLDIGHDECCRYERKKGEKRARPGLLLRIGLESTEKRLLPWGNGAGYQSGQRVKKKLRSAEKLRSGWGRPLYWPWTFSDGYADTRLQSTCGSDASWQRGSGLLATDRPRRAQAQNQTGTLIMTRAPRLVIAKSWCTCSSDCSLRENLQSSSYASNASFGILS